MGFNSNVRVTTKLGILKNLEFDIYSQKTQKFLELLIKITSKHRKNLE